MTRRIALLLAALLLAAPAVLAQPAVIAGTASWSRGRGDLLPFADLEVELVDLARLDTPPGRIAFASFRTEGRLTMPFTLPYDPARITPQGRYALRAVVTDNNRVIHRTERPQPVVPGGGAAVTLALRRDPARPVRHLVPEELAGHTWVLEEMRGHPGVRGTNFTLVVDLQGRRSGRAGCVTYRRGPDSRDRTVTTPIACPSAALRAQGRAFLASMEGLGGEDIQGNVLRLTNLGEVEVLRFLRQE